MQPSDEEDGSTTEITTHREDNEPRNEKIKLLTNADKAAWKAFDDYIKTHKGRKLQKS